MKSLIPSFEFRRRTQIPTFYQLIVSCILVCLPWVATGQQSIFRLMDTTGLTLDHIEVLANQHFERIGTGKGTGFKPFQRWLYEMRFHLDENGYIIPRQQERHQYKAFLKANSDTEKRSQAPWVELGPDYWDLTSGWIPGNGRITSIAIHPSNASIIYVSSPGGGIWKTTNGGSSWVPLVDFENADWMYVYNMAVDPNSPAKVYAGLMQDGGVLKSIDSGNSWEETGAGPENIKKILVHPTNTNIVLVTSSTGIHRSTNGGTSWSLVNSNSVEDIEFKPGDPNIVYASGYPGFFRSTNNGTSWTAIGAAGGITNSGRTMIAVTPHNPSVVYVIQANGDTFGRIYKSTNSGSSFITTIVGNPVNGTNFFGLNVDGTSTDGQGGYDMAICANSSNQNELYIAGINCYKSVDGGFSFYPISDWYYVNNTIGYNHADVHAMLMHNGILYTGSDGGIYKSGDGGENWEDLSAGLAIRQIYRLSCTEASPNVVCIGSQDNGTSRRQPNGEWIDWLGADGMDNAISHTNANYMYAVSQYGLFHRSTNGGQTRFTPSNQPSSGNWVTPLCVDASNHNIVYIGWDGVYKTTNGGDTWSNISSGSIGQYLDNLKVSTSNSNFIYASAGPYLYRTSNGGSSWTSLNLEEIITSIYVSSDDPNKIWITLDRSTNNVKVSTNMGTTFTDISAGLPSIIARCITVDEEANNGVYVGMNIGVFYKNDNSGWEPYGTDMPLVEIRDIEIVHAANVVRVGTYGRGVWEAELESGSSALCPESCCTSFVYNYDVCDDFELYATGNIVPQGNPPFSLYNNLPAAQAAVSTAQHISGTKSLRFTATSDILFTVNRTINSPTRMEWMTYIPGGKTAAFGFYTTTSTIYPIHVEYANGVARIFNQTSQGSTEVGSFSYSTNVWFKSVLIFFPGSRIEYWQNGALRYTVTNYTSNQIGAFNFYYGDTGSAEFYLDDICYREKQPDYPCTLNIDPVCVNGVTYDNDCLAAYAGYSSCETSEGECETVGCTDCDECFWFQPRYEVANVVDFQSRYCFDGTVSFQIPDPRTAMTTYQWSVPNAAEQYIGGTSATSINPSIQFPGAGSYTVCQQILENGTLVFECCRTVFTGTCSNTPLAFFTVQEVLFNRFRLTSNAGGNHVQWRLLDPDAFFFEGTENSPSPVVVLGSGGCTTVCLYVTNACGTSSFCMEICVNDPNCSGSTPLWITNGIEPLIENNTVEIDIPNPPGGGIANYAWDFGDGEFATSQDVIHTYPDEGNYTICLTMTVGCRTWCYCWCIPINPCTPVFTHNEGDLAVTFTGSETNLQYTISSGVPKAAGESWLVNNQPVNGNSTSLTYTFPSAGNYTVCFPYLGNDGCVHYYCVDIGAGNPFACNNITWQFASTTGYRFSIPAGSTQISWTIDETGQQIGNTATSNWVPPVSPCGWKTISVRYFDGARYRICCLRVYLCPPDECATSVDYGYLASTNQTTFKLNSSDATDITWYFDDTPTQTLGTNSNLAIPYPGTCVSRWISVRYKDSAGRWRICCRQIYFCNPTACNSILVNYVSGIGYSFTSEQSQQQMSWIVEETNTALGNALTSSYLPVGSSCDYRTVSLRYWDPALGWRLCCVRFYWCDPAACGDNIAYSVSGNSLVLQAPNNLQQVRWYENTTLLGSANPLSTTLSSFTDHTICLSYFDPCDNAWKWCCSTYTPGGSTGTLTFDFDDGICGEHNDIVDIPLKVRGFSNVINFQLSVQIADTTKGKLISLQSQNLTGDFESIVNNAKSGGMYWENQSAVSLTDNTTIVIARVRIVSATAGQTSIKIIGNPIPIYVEDGAGNEIVPTVRDGSFCYESLIDICGKVTREDLLPIANVNMTLSGCEQFHTTTDANGHYCFVDVPSGKSYQVSASKDTNDKNGVNSGDLTAIKRHILNILKLNSPYKIAAADSKKSNGVNTGDVSELRRLILGTITTLPTCESWEFTDKNFVYPMPADPFSSGCPGVVDLPNVLLDVNNADMIGWKMGDVNLSNNPQSSLEAEIIESRSLTDIYLFASSELVQGFDTFWVDITTRAFESISNGQFSLRYDPAVFDLHGTGHYHPDLDLSVDNFHIDAVNGSLGFVWDAIAAVTVPDDAVLFSLKFTSKFSQVDASEVYFSQDPVSYYFENFAGEELNVITSNGEVTVPVKEIKTQQVLVVPNPTTGQFFLTGLHGAIQYLEILDSRGIRVYEARDVDVASRIDLTLPGSGVYMITVVQGERIYGTRVVVIR